MNRTVKEATAHAFHYADLESLKAHVLSFVSAYNFAKDLKALKWKTPFQSICDAWKANPASFKINLHHLIPGPHIAGEADLRGALCGQSPGDTALHDPEQADHDQERYRAHANQRP